MSRQTQHETPHWTGWALIPPHILARDDLSGNDKLVLGRIFGLSEKKGYCFATNKFLAEGLGISPGTVSNIISKLVDEKILTRRIQRNEKNQIIQRRLYPFYSGEVSTEECTPIHDSVDTPIHGIVEEEGRDKRGEDRGESSSSDSGDDGADYFSLTQTMEEGFEALQNDTGRMSYIQEFATARKVDLDEIITACKSKIISNPDKYESLFKTKQPIDAAGKILNAFVSRARAGPDDTPTDYEGITMDSVMRRRREKAISE